MKLTGNIKTTIICDDEKKHVYEIVREMDAEGEEIILLTLYPTLTTPNELDLTAFHMLNHADDPSFRINKIHFVFLFSKVVGAKLSTKGLVVDHENLEYLQNLLKDNPTIKLVISYGASMEKCPAVIESKVEFFKIVKKLRPDQPLWQLNADDMEESAPHALFAGIRYASCDWSLRHYVVPYKFTPEGYAAYLESKEEARQRFIETVLGKPKADTVVKEEKGRKGRKKSDKSQES